MVVAVLFIFFDFPLLVFQSIDLRIFVVNKVKYMDLYIFIKTNCLSMVTFSYGRSIFPNMTVFLENLS